MAPINKMLGLPDQQGAINPQMSRKEIGDNTGDGYIDTTFSTLST
ncbi:hypothetical protein [Dyadobacter psychrotolerans]|nr:hypothetical protein [Dyadobacter psychrotolerans]